MKFSGDGHNAFDEYDAVKRKNGYFNLSSFSSDSISLAINHVSESFCDRSIGLMLDAMPGNYTLLFDGSLLAGGGVVNLTDRFANRVVALESGASYAFQVTSDPASSGKRRFAIEIPSATLQDPTITIDDDVLTSSASSGNQWFLNGEGIEGATAASFTPETSGEYTVEVTLDGCTRVSQPVSITVTVTGIHLGLDPTVSFYPNPAANWIRILMHAPASEEIHYTLTSSVGAQVLNGELASRRFADGGQIDVSGLASGVYFLSLRAGAQLYRARIVIDRSRP